MLGCTKSEKIANVSNNYLNFNYYWVIVTPELFLIYKDSS